MSPEITQINDQNSVKTYTKAEEGESTKKVSSPIKTGYNQYTSPINCHNKQKIPDIQYSKILSPSVTRNNDALLCWQRNLSNPDESIYFTYQ